VGTIVVGVDGSAGAQLALEWALEEAKRRGSDVAAVLAWMLPLSEAPGPFLLTVPGPPTPPVEQVRRELGAAAAARLDAALDAGRSAAPGVEVRRRVIEGAPATVLVDEAAGADMLVVGTRGHGGFAALLLGSVALGCIQHARCPVVVVPNPREEDR
jgi:nucleotide-binding universal stress UspA family protein